MVKLKMMHFSFSGHARADGVHSTWWIGSINHNVVDFPSNDRMSQIWNDTMPDQGELSVITDYVSNHRGVKIPKGIPPAKRQPFLDALSMEVTAS